MSVFVPAAHQMRRHLAGCLVLVLALVLAGCSTLPRHGPTAMDIALQSVEADAYTGQYIVVTLDGLAIDALNRHPGSPLPSHFNIASGGPQGGAIGVGDGVQINIWEASADGLFSTAENKQVSLSAIVDATGEIFVPYVGRVRAAGRSVEALRVAIEQGLQGQAVEPQVQVLLTDNQSSSVTVIGDVSGPGQYPLAVRGMRLMDAIAQAGGTREATFESVATITRAGRSGTIRLDQAAAHPGNNVWLAPGDNILVLHRPRSYSAFGAIQNTQLVPFRTETLTLIEALAQVGGLSDQQADSGGVFLFRFESYDVAKALAPQQVPRFTSGQQVPVIYRLDFGEAQAFFNARAFEIRDKDVLYVANHPTTEFNKFLSILFAPVIGVANTIVNVVN